MNESTEILIRELAEKFGTTGEHLWGVLVRQAPITGTVELLVLVGWAIAVVWAFRFVRNKTTAPPATDSERHPFADWRDEAAFLAWFLWGSAALITVIIGGTSLSNIIAALVNPEYWALQQLIPN